MTHVVTRKPTTLNIFSAIRSIRACSTTTNSASSHTLLHQSCVSRRASCLNPIARTDGPRISAGINTRSFFHTSASSLSNTAASMGKPKALLLGAIDQ